VSSLSDKVGVIHDDDGRPIGRVTKMHIQTGLPTEALRLDPVMLVAGSHEQAHFWAREMRLELRPQRRHHDPPAVAFTPSRPPYPDHHRCREAFFVGTWGSIGVDAARRLWADLCYACIPAYYVCGHDGEIIGRRLEWCRWSLDARRRPTSWHVFEDTGPAGTYKTLCGVSASVNDLCNAPSFEADHRWGPPPGACGICAHMHWRQPAGTPLMRTAMAATQSAERAFRDLGGSLGTTAITMETLRHVWEGGEG
jgi:hypothetical protein